MQLAPNKRIVDRLAGSSRPVDGGSLSKGFELVGVLVVFTGLGWFLDSLFGTTPWITLVMFVLAVIGQFARTWYVYDEEMKAHEQRLTGGRPR